MRIIKKKKITDANANVNLVSLIVSSFFLTGFIPIASGTFGSLAALSVFLIKDFSKPEILIPSIILAVLSGIYTSKSMMKKYGDDPSVVVIDEVAGMWITVLVFIVLSDKAPDLIYYFILFIAFRFFDIVKLQPAKYFDRMKSSAGVVMDDVISGIYAGVIVYLFSLTKIINL